MSQLVPCSSCGRHVRLTDATCPFCETKLDTAGLHALYAPRREGVQSGIKRAAMFALGASMAAACGDDTSVQPLYGAPITDVTSEGTDGGTGTDEDSTSEPTAQPLYGAPVTSDTSATSEPTAQPVYGAPITDTTFTSDGSSGDAGVAAPDGGDAGDVDVTSGADASSEGDVTSGADSGAPTGEGSDGGLTGWIDSEDTGFAVQPLYGAPIRN